MKSRLVHQLIHYINFLTLTEHGIKKKNQKFLYESGFFRSVGLAWVVSPEDNIPFLIY